MSWQPPDDFAPETGIVFTHLLIVRDVDRSREFYHRALGATVIRDRAPCLMRFENSHNVDNTEGGPTDDKPDVRASAPLDSRTLSSAMNIRVRDVHAVHAAWTARGGEFLTPPKDLGLEIRCHLRDPDGYPIEVGQGTGILEQMGRDGGRTDSGAAAPQGDATS